jgi:hypothetical protein
VAGVIVIPLPAITNPDAEGVKSAVDWPGGTVVTIALTLLMFALTEGNVVGWETPWVPSLIVVAILLVALFAFWQWFLEKRTHRRPLMKITIWKNYRFAAAMIIMLMFHASFNNYLIFGTY